RARPRRGGGRGVVGLHARRRPGHRRGGTRPAGRDAGAAAGRGGRRGAGRRAGRPGVGRRGRTGVAGGISAARRGGTTAALGGDVLGLGLEGGALSGAPATGGGDHQPRRQYNEEAARGHAVTSLTPQRRSADYEYEWDEEARWTGPGSTRRSRGHIEGTSRTLWTTARSVPPHTESRQQL